MPFEKTYRYKLLLPSGYVTVTPSPSGDVSKKYTEFSGQRFKRAKLEGKLLFNRDDYFKIMNAPFDHVFVINIDQRNFDGTWNLDWYVGKFTRTICKPINEDDRTIEVEPIPVDEYTKVLEGLDREFDLIELAPALTELDLSIQPLFQVYLRGSNYVTNFSSGDYYEQEVVSPEISLLALRDDFHFTIGDRIIYAPGGWNGTLSPDISGSYDPITFKRQDGHYKLSEQQAPFQKWTVIDLLNNDNVVYEAPIGQDAFSSLPHSVGGAEFTSLTDSNSKVQFFDAVFCCRLLTNKTVTTGGSNTNPIPENDLVADQGRYKRVIGYDYGGFVGFDGNDTVENQYGKFSVNALNFADRYFIKPVFAASTGIKQVYPLVRSEWFSMSWWFYYDDALRATQESEATPYTIKQCYKLADVISALLSELDPSLSHGETAVHSDFYYGNNNIVRGSGKTPMITPKSNVVIGEFDKPANKAPIKLSDLLSLCAAKQVFFYIENNRFILEHELFFSNGKSYAAAGLGIDLTAFNTNAANSAYPFDVKEYEFESFNMPEEIRFSWMDEVSSSFSGEPIKMVSNYKEEGNFRDVPVSLFTSDIDFVHAQGSSISKTGFMFFEAVLDETLRYKLPFVNLSSLFGLSYNHRIQNGFAAFPWMHQSYWIYSAPCSEININGSDFTALTVQRNKIQDLTITVNEELDEMLLIKSRLGIGEIKEIDFGMNDNEAKIKIRHDTE